MKNTINTLTIFVILFSLFATGTNSIAQKNSNCITNGLIADIPRSPLNEDEMKGLILIREEEKLARDVYTTMGDTWGIPIFYNISRAEQVHTDAVKALLDRYDIDDPVKNDTIGIFTSPELTELYKELTDKGSKSLMDALEVGATIEDLDIKDLNELLSKTDNEDITVTYKNLNKGSRNHMRAFTRQLYNRGETYQPQFISQVEFNSIINSQHERGYVR